MRTIDEFNLPREVRELLEWDERENEKAETEIVHRELRSQRRALEAGVRDGDDACRDAIDEIDDALDV